MRKMMRRLMAVGIAGMVGISMMGCGSSKSSGSESEESKSTASAKSDGGEVNLIIWTEYLPEDHSCNHLPGYPQLLCSG